MDREPRIISSLRRCVHQYYTESIINRGDDFGQNLARVHLLTFPIRALPRRLGKTSSLLRCVILTNILPAFRQLDTEEEVPIIERAIELYDTATSHSQAQTKMEGSGRPLLDMSEPSLKLRESFIRVQQTR